MTGPDLPSSHYDTLLLINQAMVRWFLCDLLNRWFPKVVTRKLKCNDFSVVLQLEVGGFALATGILMFTTLPLNIGRGCNMISVDSQWLPYGNLVIRNLFPSHYIDMDNAYYAHIRSTYLLYLWYIINLCVSLCRSISPTISGKKRATRGITLSPSPEGKISNL